MIIKTIDNDEFIDLCKLNALMYKSIDPNIDLYGATNTLMFNINNKEDFIAIGLYENGLLVGFVTGYKISKKVFHFSGICVIIKNNEWTKKLIDYCFAFIKTKGYSAWTVDATNGNISSIMEKYGAVAKYTRYYKDMN